MHFYVSVEQGKACTMNCSAPAGDPRTQEDIVRNCDDCDHIPSLVEIEASRQEHIRVMRIANALLGIANEDGKVVVSRANMQCIVDRLSAINSSQAPELKVSLRR